MRTEAASGGFFHSELWERDFPKIQLRTVAEMLAGQGFELPPTPSAYQPAQRVRRSQGRRAQMEGLGTAWWVSSLKSRVAIYEAHMPAVCPQVGGYGV